MPCIKAECGLGDSGVPEDEIDEYLLDRPDSRRMKPLGNKPVRFNSRFHEKLDLMIFGFSRNTVHQYENKIILANDPISGTTP